jgi:hypothetical protein
MMHGLDWGSSTEVCLVEHFGEMMMIVMDNAFMGIVFGRNGYGYVVADGMIGVVWCAAPCIVSAR